MLQSKHQWYNWDRDLVKILRGDQDFIKNSETRDYKICGFCWNLFEKKMVITSKFISFKFLAFPTSLFRTCKYEMASNKLENGAQCCFNKYNCRLFISKFSHLAFYSSLSLSDISKSLAQPCCKCCSLWVSVVVNVRFTTNGMCVKNNTMWPKQANIKWARRGILIVAWCHSVKLCALAAWPIQSQQSGALTRMWRWCQVQPSQKARAIGAIHCKNEGMLLQLLGWCCIESVVFACQIHEKDLRWTCTWI